MAPKRPNDDEPTTTARERKKQKVVVARTIAVQESTTPSSVPENAVACPSRTVTFVDSMKGLPNAIDVEKFAEARSFEINAMQNAMESASGGSGQRVWQTLPRHLRRRAASHDVRRVPLRLRDRARVEMDPVKRKALGRSKPKRGKLNGISRTDALLKRQRDKTWLETHIWHAKRMKMENMWGYRLAVHPTEKSFRPSHRASMHGSILHDASYYSLIELKGPEKVLRSLLEYCCDLQGQGPGAKRFLTGARILDTHIYKPGSYPFNLIAPITVMWKPAQLVSSSSSADKHSTTTAAPPSSQKTKIRKSKGKGKTREADIGEASAALVSVSDPDVRTVWIRSHPTVFDRVFSALQTSASASLEATKQSSGAAEAASTEVEIADLREHVNVFEIMGPKSNQVLKGALTPVGDDKREEFKKFWLSLTSLQTSGSLPRGMVIGFKVHDPRLKFPPKNAKPKIDHSTLPSLSSPVTTFPSSSLAQSELWEESTRKTLQKPRFKKKDLDQRRSQNLIPGTYLAPQRQDDRIPILLIQRSLESSASNPNSASQAIHGWTLIIPSGWSMPFFSSLTYTGTRVGGQRERQNQFFEAGLAYFPRDYPLTDAYASYAEERKGEEKGRWERKPPAKRANFEKLGTRSPWNPDWEVVLGLKIVGSQGDNDLVPTQRGGSSIVKKVQPWLLRGTDVPTILENVSSMFNHGAGLLAEVNKMRIRRSQDPLENDVRAEDLWETTLVMVRLTMCGRGAPDDLAVIYIIDDDEARKWDYVFDRNKCFTALLDKENPEVELSNLRPPQDSIIGYITSGNFSLSRGEGFSIGAIPIARLLELKQQAARLRHPSSLLVKIRDRDGDTCRAAHLELLVE